MTTFIITLNQFKSSAFCILNFFKKQTPCGGIKTGKKQNMKSYQNNDNSSCHTYIKVHWVRIIEIGSQLATKFHLSWAFKFEGSRQMELWSQLWSDFNNSNWVHLFMDGRAAVCNFMWWSQVFNFRSVRDKDQKRELSKYVPYWTLIQLLQYCCPDTYFWIFQISPSFVFVFFLHEKCFTIHSLYVFYHSSR